jgi:hypothetical protein
VNKEFMKLFQIFERFMNVSSTGAKNAFHVKRKVVEAIIFFL